MPDRRLYFARWDGVQWDGSRKKNQIEGNQTGLKLPEQLTRHGGLRCENVEGLKPTCSNVPFNSSAAWAFFALGCGISIGDGVPLQPHWEVLPHVVAR